MNNVKKYILFIFKWWLEYINIIVLGFCRQMLQGWNANSVYDVLCNRCTNEQIFVKEYYEKVLCISMCNLLLFNSEMFPESITPFIIEEKNINSKSHQSENS